MRLVVFGPQGAGKGTQGAMLAEKYGIPDIATGDIFRWAISGGTALGLEVKEYVESGSLVPDELTIKVVRERLWADDCVNGWLLDGFPRSLAQADALDAMLSESGDSLDAALVIEVPEDVSVRRLQGRRVCSKCGRNYHIDVPPARDWTCDSCGGEVVERTDDHEEAKIRHRLALYHVTTEPLKDYYAKSGLLREIDGLGSPDEVFARIVEVL